MLAMIMAGGEGERLRPLTCTLPKPMTLVLDQPVLAYSLRLLARHGVERAGITLGYLPDQIEDAFGDGSEYGVSLKYFRESRPMGTAGGIKPARAFLTETFCVLSGDGLTDVNLSEALAFHRAHGAKATLVLKRVQNPTSYGLVSTDADGRIVSFTEKPDWKNVTSDAANTGIYILEPEILDRIPDDQPFDFGRELFPLLLREGVPMYGYLTEAYWCDIGDVSAYLEANREALEGRISLIDVPEGGIVRMPGAIVDEEAILEAPVFLGAGARIGAGAKVLAGSVIGAGAVVAENASVKRAVLYPGSFAGRDSELRSCVLAPRAQVLDGAQAFEESVIGEDSRIGARGCVKPGVRVWPGKRVPDGAVVFENLVWGQRLARAFMGVSIRAVTPEDAVRAGRAIVWRQKPGNVLIGRATSSVAASQARALAAGLCSQGAQVYTIGECTLPQLRHVLSLMRLDAAVYAESDAMTPLYADGTPLTPPEKRKIEDTLNRQDMPRPYTGITRPISNVGRSDLGYLGFLKSAAFGHVRRLRAAVYAQSEQLLYLADHAFQNAGFTARVEWEEELMELSANEIGVYLSASGEKAVFADEDGLLTDAQMELLTGWAMAEHGETTLYAPPDATRALDALGRSLGLKVVFASGDLATWARTLSQVSPFQYHMRFDGLFLSLHLLSRLNENALSLADFRARMPEVSRVSHHIDVDFPHRGEVMRRLSDALPPEFEREDWFFRGQHGCAWIRPDEERPYCTVTAEARDAEFAQEICDLFSGLLQKAADEAQTH